MRLDLLTELNTERAARRAAILVTDIATNEQRFVREAEARRRPSRRPCSKSAFRSGKSGLVEAGGRELFLTVQVPPVEGRRRSAPCISARRSRRWREASIST